MTDEREEPHHDKPARTDPTGLPTPLGRSVGGRRSLGRRRLDPVRLGDDASGRRRFTWDGHGQSPEDGRPVGHGLRLRPGAHRVCRHPRPCQPRHLHGAVCPIVAAPPTGPRHDPAHSRSRRTGPRYRPSAWPPVAGHLAQEAPLLVRRGRPPGPDQRPSRRRRLLRAHAKRRPPVGAVGLDVDFLTWGPDDRYSTRPRRVGCLPPPYPVRRRRPPAPVLRERLR